MVLYGHLQKKEEMEMGMYFNPGNEMFQRAVRSEIYVDRRQLEGL